MVITEQIRVRSTRSERTWNARSSLKEVCDARRQTKDDQKKEKDERIYEERKQEGESLRTKGGTQKMRRCTPQCGIAPDPIAMPVSVPRGSQRVSTNYEIISIDIRHLPEILPSYIFQSRTGADALISSHYFLMLFKNKFFTRYI